MNGRSHEIVVGNERLVKATVLQYTQTTDDR